MQDRPTGAELLETVGTFLEAELMPALDGPLAYRTRVAANLVRILEREAHLGHTALVRERELLTGCLGVSVVDTGTRPLADEVRDLNARLVDEIASGRVGHAQVWDALMEIARAKLAIIRPGYDAWDAVSELP